jgi:hypothetical protein
VNLRKLTEIASRSLGARVSGDDPVLAFFDEWGARGLELKGLLVVKNGFYAFESSLLLRGVRTVRPPMDLVSWNDRGLWVGEYGELIKGRMLFFGEDVFGTQFAIRSDRVVMFDPETGGVDDVAGSVEEWATLLLERYAYYTGHPVAHEWQVRNGPLPQGKKLLPTKLFAFGGKFTVENMGPVDEVESMRFRASIARQIKEVGDGTAVRLDIVD